MLSPFVWGKNAAGGFFQYGVVDILRELGVEVIRADLWTRARCLAGANIEEANLMPDDSADVDFDGSKRVN